MESKDIVSWQEKFKNYLKNNEKRINDWKRLGSLTRANKNFKLGYFINSWLIEEKRQEEFKRILGYYDSSIPSCMVDKDTFLKVYFGAFYQVEKGVWQLQLICREKIVGFGKEKPRCVLLAQQE